MNGRTRAYVRPSSPQNEEEAELAGLVGRAWERRGEADFREHVEAIADWFDRRHVRRWERRQRSTAAVLHVLQETRP
jgi:hypothetical protein